MALHDELVAGAISEHRGHLVEMGREGDSVMAVFPWAADAVHAAAAIQRSVRDAPWPEEARLRIRIALHTGEAELRGGHYYGQAVYRCARLLAAGNGGQVLVSLATRQVVVDALPPGISLIDHGEHRLNDLVRPEHIYQLADEVAPPDPRPIRSLDRRLTNLPTQLTALVGRESALDQLTGVRGDARLLTLIGAGGSGKTRLAVELASRAVGAEPDGVWLVELGPLTDGDSVGPAIGRVLGLAEHPGRSVAESLVEQLAQRHLTLVLDNCEHLVGPVADLVLRLLGGCPEVDILATSREPLGVPGEVSWRVPSLELDDAVALFIGRAREHRPDLLIDDTSKVTAAQVCTRLDGLPLALELAAAQADALSLSEIASRLEDRFVLLSRGARTAPARQQTLRSTVEWSHNLLDGNEQTLLRRLSVFAGSLDLAGAEAVATGGDLAQPAIVPCLAGLVKKSLVVPAEGRYRLHETIREFARERLKESGETDVVQRHLASHLLAKLVDNPPGHYAAWLDEVEVEHDNLRAALAWWVAADPALAAELAHHCFRYWNARGHINEGRRALDSALASIPDPSTPIAVECLIDSACFAYLEGEAIEARQRLERALAAAEAAADDLLIARAHYASGLVEAAAGDPVRAEANLEQALPLWQGLGDGGMEAEILHLMGILAGGRGDVAAAENLFQRSLDIRRRAGRGDQTHITLTFLAAVKVASNDIEGARTAIRESLELGRQLGDVRAAWALEVCGCIAVSDSDPERAIVLSSVAASMHASAGASPPEIWLALMQSYTDRARAAMTPAVVAAAEERGRTLSFPAAIDYALETRS